MKLKKIVSIALTGSVMALSAGAYAIPTVVPGAGSGTCGSASVGVFVAGASECAGAYGGNVLNNKGSNVTTQIAALAALGLDFNPSGAGSFNFNDFLKIDFNGGNTNSSANTISLGSNTVTGITIIGVHFGNGSPIKNTTSFYKFDAGTAGTSTITFSNIKAISDLMIYSTGGTSTTPTTPSVPEPATWTMLLAGFALMSVVMRRRQTTPIVS